MNETTKPEDKIVPLAPASNLILMLDESCYIELEKHFHETTEVKLVITSPSDIPSLHRSSKFFDRVTIMIDSEIMWNMEAVTLMSLKIQSYDWIYTFVISGEIVYYPSSTVI
jgi:hypothetical protein